MAAPTWVSPKYETVWTNSTSPKTVSVTVAAGDALVVLVGAENGDGSPVFTPSGVTGATWTSLRVGTAANDGAVAVLHTIVPTSGTYTLSVARTPASTNLWGFVALRFSSVTGVVIRGSAVNTGTTWASSTTGANSALAWIATDWNAVDGASRSYSTASAGAFTEQTYFRNSSNYGVYGGVHPDAGAAGAKTLGLSTPTGVLLTGISVEIQGAVATQTFSGTSVATSGAAGTLARSSLGGLSPAVALVQGAVPRSQLGSVSPVVSQVSGAVSRSQVAGVSDASVEVTGAVGRSALAGVAPAVVTASGTVTPAASPGFAGTAVVVSGAQGRLAVSQVAGSASVVVGTQGSVSRSAVSGRADGISGAAGALSKSRMASVVAVIAGAQGSVQRSWVSGTADALSGVWGYLGDYTPQDSGERTLVPVLNARTMVPVRYTQTMTSIPNILLLTPVES